MLINISYLKSLSVTLNQLGTHKPGVPVSCNFMNSIAKLIENQHDNISRRDFWEDKLD